LIQAQCFADGPCLEWTPARRVWPFGVGNFRNVAEAGFLEVAEERGEKFFASLALYSGVVTAHADPRLDERSNQAGPDRSLMI